LGDKRREYYKSEPSLGYMERACLKKKKKKESLVCNYLQLDNWSPPFNETLPKFACKI
jgi:hypothetical protein